VNGVVSDWRLTSAPRLVAARLEREPVCSAPC
jgi:hypothetical protein